MSYCHFTIDEREKTYLLYNKGLSIRNIAQKLGRNPSSVSRELRRIKDEYMPHKAQKDYENKRRACHKPRILDTHPQLCTFIAAKIVQAHWSPEQICGRLWREFHFKLSPNTIYRHIYQHNLNQPFTSKGDTGIRRKLRHKHHLRRPKNVRKHREALVDYLPISQRPHFINERKRIGDWELDTVIGKTGEACLMTLVERQTRYTIIRKINHKDCTSVNSALLGLVLEIPKEYLLSITPDHGREFLQLDQIKAALGVQIYWPDPYAPQERGTNENTNGLIREYFPKRQSLKDITNTDVRHCEEQLNHRPRKELNYQTPAELFWDQPQQLIN